MINDVKPNFLVNQKTVPACFSFKGDSNIELGERIVARIKGYNFKTGSMMRARNCEAFRRHGRKVTPQYLKTEKRYQKASLINYGIYNRMAQRHYPENSVVSFSEFAKNLEPNIIREGAANCNEQAFMAAARLEKAGKKPHIIGLRINYNGQGKDSRVLKPVEDHYFAAFNFKTPPPEKGDLTEYLSSPQNRKDIVAVDPWSGFCKGMGEAMNIYKEAYGYEPGKHKLEWFIADDYKWGKTPIIPEQYIRQEYLPGK